MAIDDAVTATGAVVERMDFPYRVAGRRAPDRAPVLIEAVRHGAAALRPKVGRLVVGGRSMGGRMCSMAVAGGLPADGLVLVSYPLHPPGKPEKLRIEHLGELSVPCLFVSGTHDAFGRPEELEAATEAIRGRVTHHWIEGGDHGLRRADDEVARVVSEWFSQVVGRPD